MGTVEEFIKELEEFGFKKVLEVPFKCANEPEHKGDAFYAFFLEKYGIILTFDTYGNGETVNGGNFFYEWLPEGNGWATLTSSGGFEEVAGKRIWVGDHDCRWGAIRNIKRMAELGKFVTPWVSDSDVFRPRFVHWGDHHVNYNTETWDDGFARYNHACETVGKERYNALPDYVKKAIGIAYQGELGA